MSILKRRSRMVSFRLSEDEYSDLKHLCLNGAARSVSELARDALQKLIITRNGNGKHPVETVVHVLQNRVDALDLEVKRLALVIEQASARPVREDDANL